MNDGVEPLRSRNITCQIQQDTNQNESSVGDRLAQDFASVLWI